MTKCDFCICSDEKGKCCWNTQPMRQDYCKDAIKRMLKVLRKGKREDGCGYSFDTKRKGFSELVDEFIKNPNSSS